MNFYATNNVNGYSFMGSFSSLEEAKKNAERNSPLGYSDWWCDNWAEDYGDEKPNWAFYPNELF